MKVIVDLTRCQGYAQCAFAAPEVFAMRGDEALLYDSDPGQGQRERIERAVAACPVQAILVDREGGRHRLSPETSRGLGEEMERIGRIVIVGASLAGLRAASVLRREGFAGSLTMIGDEAHPPYDRPPLSKQVLIGRASAQGTVLPRHDEFDVRWRLGVPATGLDLGGKQVILADGQRVRFDRMLIATGLRARAWPKETAAGLDGVCTIRTPEDAEGLRRRLAAGPSRVLVIGAGFTGCEVAAACRELDVLVTMVDRGPAPLAGALGAVIGRIAAQMHRDHGVDLRCGVQVEALEGDRDGRLRRARLSDGTTMEVDVAVAALGSVRNVEWLEGAGLAAGPWGVACDAGCRAVDANGVVTDDVFVAGDVARFPHPVYGFQYLALEHWGNAVAQAEIAAHNMISPQSRRWAHLALPEFWSTQYDAEIKSVGVPTYADQVVIPQGSVAQRRFVAVYGYRGRITAAVAFNQSKWLEFYAGLINQAAPFPPSFRTVDQPPDVHPVPAEVPVRPTYQATVVVTGHTPGQRRATLVRRPYL
ncbi:FAD-dependent oxidoreductase [Kutzneria buriramensis]|uniref:NADPH-dependent 2,4-dienoyl-CoA reductase/sulfur reductase-like enzyme n=1 Tax=Kutzneria buriramensis TaxID=1045776 RepID=A0A3E0HM13_9PSEU|nr:FAD-dependent oxidoreductase [Kutzneria buriramensis]REH47075.1 NADPH-dependent 2,4-dienoyl-CoA reductase/sulfur reductase-like enzyme [Kutzneria buriramensis]